MATAPSTIVEDVVSLLVVDDNEANHDMLSRRLIRKGFAVTCAADGHEALERNRRSQAGPRPPGEVVDDH